MTKIVAPGRPAIDRRAVDRILARAKVVDPVALVGLRGFEVRMGSPGNDRGIYDDAIVLVSANGLVAFNANTDPSIRRKHVAVLAPGKWAYKIGTHGLSRPPEQRYEALVQAAPVTVIRDQEGPDTGWFGINIHRGSYGGTSSLGCQTIWPDQWPSFIGLVKSELRRAGQKTLPYVLEEV